MDAGRRFTLGLDISRCSIGYALVDVDTLRARASRLVFEDSKEIAGHISKVHQALELLHIEPLRICVERQFDESDIHDEAAVDRDALPERIAFNAFARDTVEKLWPDTPIDFLKPKEAVLQAFDVLERGRWQRSGKQKIWVYESMRLLHPELMLPRIEHKMNGAHIDQSEVDYDASDAVMLARASARIVKPTESQQQLLKAWNSIKLAVVHSGSRTW